MSSKETLHHVSETPGKPLFNGVQPQKAANQCCKAENIIKKGL